MKRGIIFLLLLPFLLQTVSAALGIGPATQEVDFRPGQTYTFNYHVISDDPDQEITIYAEGDLAQYVTLSKTSSKGPTAFTATITFPQSISVPGKHQLLIGAREKPREDVFIGATINIRAVIYVHVPYPGKYAELELNIPNANAGDNVPIEAHVINRGNEEITANVKIDFYQGERYIETMMFEPVSLISAQDRYFRKYLNSSTYKPGAYLARAEVDFGQKVETNVTFRIGSLFVNVTNFTARFPQGGIQKFFVNIESQWNNRIPAVFADVNLTNGEQNSSFRTPSISLEPWSSDTLTGYLDTSGLSGTYDTQVVLSYGEGQTLMTGTVTIVNETLQLVIYIVAGVVVGLVILFLVIWYIIRKRRKK